MTQFCKKKKKKQTSEHKATKKDYKLPYFREAEVLGKGS